MNSKENIYRGFISRENVNLIYDLVCDIFEKKSNFNLERNIGKKNVYTIIHAELKKIYTTFIGKLVSTKKTLLDAITILNKYTVQNTVIILSKQEAYKRFIEAVVKPKNIQRSIDPVIIPRTNTVIKSEKVSNYTPERPLESSFEAIQNERFPPQEIKQVNFQLPMDEDKPDLNNMLTRYEQERVTENLEMNKVAIPEETEISLNDLELSLFGTNTHDGGYIDQDNNERREETTEDVDNKGITLEELVDNTIENLVLIKEYLQYLKIK